MCVLLWCICVRCVCFCDIYVCDNYLLNLDILGNNTPLGTNAPGTPRFNGIFGHKLLSKMTLVLIGGTVEQRLGFATARNIHVAHLEILQLFKGTHGMGGHCVRHGIANARPYKVGRVSRNVQVANLLALDNLVRALIVVLKTRGTTTAQHYTVRAIRVPMKVQWWRWQTHRTNIWLNWLNITAVGNHIGKHSQVGWCW